MAAAKGAVILVFWAKGSRRRSSKGLPDHGAQDGPWRSQDTLEPGDVLQIDPACPVFLPVNEFHDRVLRNSDQIDLIPGEKIQLLMEAGAGKGQERHVQKALQDHFLQIHTVFFCDLHMVRGYRSRNRLSTGGSR